MGHTSLDEQQEAAVLLLGTEDTYLITPGATIGRRSDDADKNATVGVDDPESFVSPVHATFRTDDASNWVVEDQSLNGTYVAVQTGAETKPEWQQLLSDAGREQREERGDTSDESHPAQHELGSIAQLALVDPSYYKFEFQTAETYQKLAGTEDTLTFCDSCGREFKASDTITCQSCGEKLV